MAIPAWVTWILDYAKSGGQLLWTSLLAIWTNHATWLACVAIFVGGFSLGHWERSRVVHKVVGEKVELSAEIDALAARLKLALKQVDEFRAAYTALAAKPAPAASPAPRAKKKTAEVK